MGRAPGQRRGLRPASAWAARPASVVEGPASAVNHDRHSRAHRAEPRPARSAFHLMIAVTLPRIPPEEYRDHETGRCHRAARDPYSWQIRQIGHLTPEECSRTPAWHPTPEETPAGQPIRPDSADLAAAGYPQTGYPRPRYPRNGVHPPAALDSLKKSAVGQRPHREGGLCKGRALQGAGSARGGLCKGRALQGAGSARGGRGSAKGRALQGLCRAHGSGSVDDRALPG